MNFKITKPKIKRDVVHCKGRSSEFWISVEDTDVYLTTECADRAVLFRPDTLKRRRMSNSEFVYDLRYSRYAADVYAEIDKQLVEVENL